jgi:hypothetical protein
MLVRVNNPKLKNHNQIGEVLSYSENYYNSKRNIPVVVVQLINHPYRLVIRISEKNLIKLSKTP